MDRKSLTSFKHWQAPVVALLGAWLAVSPWLVGPAGSEMGSGTCVALGVALVAAAAAVGYAAKPAWGAWLTVVFGLAAAVSPWLLGFSQQSAATGNVVATGLVAAVLGFMVALAASDRAAWWNDRVAH